LVYCFVKIVTSGVYTKEKKMENKKNLEIVSDILNTILIALAVIMLVLLVLPFLGLKTEVQAKVNEIELESLEYRGAKLYWEVGNPMPEERLEIFYTVMDSLADDVEEKYSLGQNPTKFLYLTADQYYFGDLTGGIGIETIAFERGEEVFLSPFLVNSTRMGRYMKFRPYVHCPRTVYDSNQCLSDGVFAMILIHEYVHVVQFNHESYLGEYAKSVGWQGDSKPDEDEDFYSVLSSYSLKKPSEDMSETFMFSYLCGNNLEALSEVRLQYIEEFWRVPREEYCRNFH